MADDEKSHKPKQHLSLNQRHNRFLVDLSASHKKSTSIFPGEENDENPTDLKGNFQMRRRLCKAFPSEAENDDVPDFSGIVDFDSPSPSLPAAPPVDGEQSQNWNQSKFAVEAADVPSFSGIVDFDSPSPSLAGISGDHCQWKSNNGITITDAMKPSNIDLDGPEVSEKDGIHDGASDFIPNPPGEEEKPVKVRIEGRRRLCKVSKKDDDHHKINDVMILPEETNCLGLSDFDSSPQVKFSVENDYGDGVKAIRDILKDLSSRLEILSIEKKPDPKMIDLIDDSKHLVKSEVNHVEKKEEVPEYGSAASSFSVSSHSSVGSVKESRAGGDFDKSYDLDDGSKINNFLGEVNKSMNVSEELKVNDVKGIGENSISTRQSFKYTSVREEKDDDCVFVSGKNFGKKTGKRHGKLKHVYEDSEKYAFLEDSEKYVMLEDSTDDFVSKDEHRITLTGPKFTFQLSGKIGKMLYPHQRDGLKWLWSLHCKGEGGVLGDDMGLGKTMQICGFLAGLFHSNLIKRALVVAPKTLLPHWIKELSVVGLSGKTREYFGTSATTRQYELQYVLQDKGVLLTTYDIVRNNAKSLSGEYYYNDDGTEDEITWDYIFLDEGHLIKNPSTQRAKSLLQIPAAHRIIVSGTPLQNNLKELWALFNFCCPELLGEYKWFRDKYEKLINRGNEKNASDREKRIGSTVAKELREKIQPYFLRRLKSEVFGEDDASNSTKLSKKNEIIVWLKLTSCQRQIYEAFLKSEIVLSAFDGSPLAALTILKKICDHPLLLTKRAAEDVLEGMDSMQSQQDHDVAEKLAMHIADVDEMFDFAEKLDISCKTSFILSLLDDLIPKGHHVLIFSQTRKMLNLIQESLVSNGYEFMRIDGTTKATDRLKIVNDFQEGRGASIFLLTTQVGGLGLTLTKADRVIVVDPAWNPSTDNQSVDRAYRIGQMKDVVVYRLMTCGTVEEKIYRMQIFKGGLFRTATEHKEQMRYFSKHDLQELFSLPKQGFDISPTQQQLLEEHGQLQK
ncbi:hypothetical protein ACH5RR_000997, partial [Cinchona calisaya]